jgi:tRNA dimethylallyltransferase
MIERGIIQEVEQFEQKFSILKLLEKDPTALQSGILQCIGFKEFVPYLKDKKEEQKCIESLQTATRNYARKQENWFRNTWASAGSTLLNPPILYELIVSGDKQEWSEKIVPAGLSIAVSLWDSSIETNCDVKKYLVIEPRSGVSKTETWEKHTCEICERTYNGPQEWADHLRSKLHKVRKSKLNKKIKM